ncbi:DUF4367 domain-containing protein [Sedimentibacter sp. MB31-C6]|uniref:DUF4367 domain-containing protein n=1 Tax=Sedimentibacter sp. MB31-C6 TaxID=3109366 RepID=UPI002DDD1D00|nr:DUF4367 domain-containing protein [Sedimentibacter sp. MB36-C1]WSI02849.1 DUF4367 domain-containing protein [Sedimentibacter sp. MB36-C1]
MSKTIDIIMKDVCELSFRDELQKINDLDNNNIIYESLTKEDINRLAKKIELLPFEYRNILFFRYCFNSTLFETDKILKIENSKKKLRYIQKMLSNFMGVENSLIDNNSMEDACQLALSEDMKDYDSIEILQKPIYSKNFIKKLKKYNIKQNNNIYILIAKKAATLILIFIMSLSTVLVFNTEARTKLFNWIIEKFPKYSIFTSQNVNEDNGPVDLVSFKIKYIPNGYELSEIHEGHNALIYNYLSGNNQMLTIKLSVIGSKSYYDTENADIEDFFFKGSQAYIWQTDSRTHLLWNQNGVDFHIIGNLNKDEIIKIAENISK